MYTKHDLNEVLKLAKIGIAYQTKLLESQQERITRAQMKAETMEHSLELGKAVLEKVSNPD